MGDGSGGANTADSYIGSLISLTSKSEIRYEGILYTVDTENSNIALQNVRSFGTEGRKKDGLPILASDKVYDYIIFRGSDIKDLQVKSSPSVQPPPQPPTDPAIISLQSQYSQPAPITPAYVQPPPGPQDAGPQLPYTGNFPSAFRSGVPPLYQHQPTAGLGSWGPPPPPPGPNGTGLAMPMYWQAGYYRPPTAQPILQQPLHPQPPPSLPMPPALQPQVLQQPPRPSAPLNLVNSMPPVTSSLSHSSGSAPSSSISVPALPVTVSGPVSGTSVSANAPGPAPVPVVSASVSAPSSVPSSIPASVAPPAVQGVSAVITPAAKNPRRVVGPIQPSPPQPQSSGAAAGTTTATTSASTASTATVAQRSQTTTQSLPGMLSSAPGKNAGTNPLKQEQKAAEPAKSQSVTSTTGQIAQQQTQPLLPLPTSSAPQKQALQGNGSVGAGYTRRGRGRGSGSGRGIVLAQPTQQFMEDFDFTAMNEKFNKDEVWGELGKGTEARDKVGDAEVEDLADGHADDEVADGPAQKISPDVPKKPVYVKDDFFDSLSCDALDREEGRAERTKFSEQRKIDTETFGNFPLRSRGGRGGRGRRGGYRGGFYGGGYMGGRGNGYGRGRGASRSATAIN
ncbi:hypothetical protein R1flu_024985 [Riccia fluitans]|uniref:Protein decapping 5 n=1 Tax=Riccia fluitans TaxID=41844 RepID=A0ABD1XXD4_9MARC